MNLDPFMERYRKTPKLVIQRAPAEDGQDRLWVVTGRSRADSTEVDVFDPRGTFLGTLRIPGDVHALKIQGADLYALVEYLSGEHDGAQGVLHYRIR
jgi:sugar lactone lactonase YvrE